MSRRPARFRMPHVPILRREAVIRSRSWSMPVTMSLYVCLLGGFALVLFAVATPDGPGLSPNPADMANVAFLTVALQLALVVLLVPPLAAPAIAAERERGTFDMLVLGRLGPRRIVATELAAPMAFVVLLVAVAAPVLAAVFLHAGLGLGQLALAELVTVATAATLGSVAVALGAWKPRTATAILASYAVGLALYAATVPLGALLGDGHATSSPVHPVVFANPFYALHAVVFTEPPSGEQLGRLVQLLVPGGGEAGAWGPVVQPWQASLAWQAALAALGFLAAAGLVAGRRLATRRLDPGRQRRRPGQPAPEPGP